jgi:PAS domain S-box-containing protein
MTPVNVLVVDDEPRNRAALEAVLGSSEYRVVSAGSGREALRRLLDDDEFAVALVDVVMPEMSGFELAAAIKGRERTAGLPIIFLTAHATDLDLIYKGYCAGAVDYLTKPLVPEIVRAKVSVFAELYRGGKRIEDQAARLVEAERREHELRVVELGLASERRYRSLAEAIPNIVWTASPDGTTDYLNERWFELTGLSVEQSAAGSWGSALHPDDEPRARSAWEAALRSGEMFQIECRLRRASDGVYRWQLGRAVAARGASGEIVSWSGTFTDIDDQKRAEAILAELIDARDEFLSIASHEIRNPLTSLNLQIELILRSPDILTSPDRMKTKLGIVASQVDRMTRLITELLDVSKITSGHLDIVRQQLDLAAVVHGVVDRLAADAAKAESSVSVRAPTPVLGRWDPMRLEQVVTNLLTNAFKFGGGHPIEVTVEGTGSHARLIVRDHGAGIAPENLDRIFDRYEQVTQSRVYGGLGLGLYIAREIAVAHGGTIRVESALGEGATFIVELPRSAPSDG